MENKANDLESKKEKPQNTLTHLKWYVKSEGTLQNAIDLIIIIATILKWN